MLACGTTTCEVKSGYGLDLESELKMLRAIRRARSRAADRSRVRRSWARTRSRSTIAARRREYVGLVIEKMIPAVAAERLADWCDVFCEHGVFTPAESKDILEAGQRAGLKARIHADELGDRAAARWSRRRSARARPTI